MRGEKRDRTSLLLDVCFNDVRPQSIISNAKFLATAQSPELFA